jgi:hypothetical protein
VAIPEYILALALTIGVETGVAAVLPHNTNVTARTVILVNLMSHPLLHYVLWTNQYAQFMTVTWPVLIGLEMGVVVLEWALLYFVVRDKATRLFFLSLAMNTASFTVGLVLFRFPG